MVVKFVRVTKPEAPTKGILTNDGSEKGKWYTCTPEVYTWASKTFKDGDEVEFVMDGKTVTRVTKVGTTPKEPPAPSEKVETKTDAAAPKTETPTKPSYKYGEKSPEVQELIIRQSTMASAAQALTALTGVFNDVAAVKVAVLDLYTSMLNEIKK